MTDATTIARMIESADGHPVLHPSGARMNIKVFAAETGGAYSLMETVLPPAEPCRCTSMRTRTRTISFSKAS